jgi:hypothetical protein
MIASPEIDREVAKAIGWRLECVEYNPARSMWPQDYPYWAWKDNKPIKSTSWDNLPLGGKFFRSEQAALDALPKFSSDANAAQKIIVDWIAATKRAAYLAVSSKFDGWRVINNYDDGGTEVLSEEETMPLAICAAIIKFPR